MLRTARPTDRLTELVDGWVERGQCLGVQLHVRRRGAIVVDHAVGVDGRGQPVGPQDRGLLLCAVKPVVAWCVLRAVDRGQLTLEDPIATHLPSFRGPGRDGVTIEQLLAHTSRIPNGVGPPPYQGSYDDIVRAAVFDPLPEHRLACASYNGTSTWHLLARVLEVRLGAPIAAIVADELAEVAGCDIGLVAPEGPLRWYGCARGPGRFVPAPIDELRARTWPNPASGGFASMGGLSALYAEVLRAVRGDSTLLAPATAGAMVRRRERVRGRPARFGADRADPWYGLGVAVGMADLGCPGWGAASFGLAGEYSGHPVVVGLADPEGDVVVGLRITSAGVRNAGRVAEVARLTSEVLAEPG